MNTSPSAATPRLTDRGQEAGRPATRRSSGSGRAGPGGRSAGRTINAVGIKERPRRIAPGAALPVPGAPHRPAIHESGHGLCARLGGLAVSAITLTQTAYTPAGESPEHLRVELAVAMAGFAADALTGQMQPVRGGDDLRVAAELAGRLTPDPHAQLQEIGTALERALAALTAHRPALHELAWTIERQGEIRGYGPVALALTVALAQRP